MKEIVIYQSVILKENTAYQPFFYFVRSELDRQHFIPDVNKYIIAEKNNLILIKISAKFLNIQSITSKYEYLLNMGLVPSRCKPLHKEMMTKFTDAYTHHEMCELKKFMSFSTRLLVSREIPYVLTMGFGITRFFIERGSKGDKLLSAAWNKTPPLTRRL